MTVTEIRPVPDDPRLAAQELARNNPDMPAAELGDAFGMGERWGRIQRAAAGVTSPRKKKSRKPAVPRAQTPERHSTAERLTIVATGVALGIVVLSPFALSFHSLAEWGHDRLGLNAPLTYIVPLTLDAAALACVGLTFHATLRADSAGASRLLVGVFAGASSWANWRHGTTISTDAAVYYAAMPLVAALLLDITLRRVRHVALGHRGGVEPPLPRYRTARWIVAPLETWRAWRTAVRRGITDPAAALAASRETSK